MTDALPDFATDPAPPRFSLTVAQADCVRVIAELNDLLGRPPTYREVAHELCVEKGAAHALAAGARERGWLADGALVALHVPPAVEDCDIEITAAGEAAAALPASLNF